MYQKGAGNFNMWGAKTPEQRYRTESRGIVA